MEDGDADEPRLKLRLIVPNSSCGGIIGKGGATIKYGFCAFYFGLLNSLFSCHVFSLV